MNDLIFIKTQMELRTQLINKKEEYRKRANTLAAHVRYLDKLIKKQNDAEIIERLINYRNQLDQQKQEFRDQKNALSAQIRSIIIDQNDVVAVNEQKRVENEWTNLSIETLKNRQIV